MNLNVEAHFTSIYMRVILIFILYHLSWRCRNHDSRDNLDPIRRGTDPGPGYLSGHRRSDSVQGQGTGGLTASLSMTDLTRILLKIEQGDTKAADQLLPLVYDELRKLAAQKLAHEKPGQTLQATALVHEAYLRLVGSDEAQRWDGHGHFFAAAAEAMRRILVENARRKCGLKHGGDRRRQALDPDRIAAPEAGNDLLALDEALINLAATEPQVAELVKLRYFAGLTIPQAAAQLQISPRTADAWWSYAKAWFQAALQEPGDFPDKR
jgi:RNA polymerase sigma factor (TIGR02999 family)